MTRELDKARALKERLRSGGLVLAAQVELNDPAVVEILGTTGFDVLIVDTEHSPHSPENVQAMLQAGVAGDAVVLARPSSLSPEMIRLYLDLGSPGVLCPFIETGDQAAALVSACRYPPAGTRGYGPRRAGGYGTASDRYFVTANDAILCIPIIESKRAIDNIDEIVAIDGIDAVCIGPADLSISLGVFQDFESEEYRAAFAAVKDACARHGKVFGTGAYSAEHAVACRDAGVQLLLTLVDDQALRAGALATVTSLR